MEPPTARIDTEFASLIGQAFPKRRRRWKVLACLVLAVVAGGGVYLSTRDETPGPVKVCDQLSLPGLTTGEGQQIVQKAIARGVSAEQMHARCGALIDEFSRP